MKNSRLGIRIAGPAGLGMHSVMDIVATSFAALGYEILTDSEYQSIIKWWLNFYDVNICKERPYISQKVDILIALDGANLDANIADISDKWVIICSEKTLSKSKKQSDIDWKLSVLSPEINDKYENTYLIGILVGFLWIEKKPFENAIKKAFLKKWDDIVQKNLDIFSEFSEKFWDKKWNDLLPEISEKSSEKSLSYGNKMISYGAIASELEFFSAYPMTPASTILTEIVNSKKVKYLQAEDEIAVINSALGASFTGARSMVATSGGGFALMTEALSFAAQAEIPVVVVLAQRAGPSTGTPTFHEQWDILYAVRPTFGDIENIVICPSTLENAYFYGWESLNLAQKYQTTVILLTDKQFAEAKATIADLQKAKVCRSKLLEKPNDDYARYALSDDGVSPYVKVGTKNGDFIATSYEHDEYGVTSENPEMKVKMTEKRFKKLSNFFEKEGIFGYEIINPSARKKIITFSLARYTAEKFVRDNPEFGLIIVHFLSPIDERLREEIAKCEEIIFVESNYSGQFETLLTEKLGLKYIPNLKISHLRKYNLFPFYIEDFEQLKKKN